MKKQHIFLFLVAILLVTACTTGESRCMLAQLEKAEEMNQKFQPFTTDSVLKSVVRYYDRWWQPREKRIRSRYMLGCAYRDLNNAPRALENYQQAVALADTTEAAILPLLMRIHSQMSEIYAKQWLTEEMLNESKTAASLAWKIGDTESALILESDYCHALFADEKYDECIEETLRLYHHFVKHGHKDRGLAVYANCVKSYFALGDYQSAKIYLDLYETCPFFETAPHKIHGGISSLYLLKGQYFIGVGQADSAEYYFQRLLQYPRFESNLLLGTKGLCQVYLLKGNTDSIVKYTQLYSAAKERDFDNAKAQATIQTKTLYDYSTERRIAHEKTKEAARHRNWIYVLVVLCIGGIFFYLYQRQRRKLEISELRRSLQMAIKELHETEEQLRMAQTDNAQTESQIALYRSKIEQKQKQIDLLEGKIRTKASWEKKANLNNSAIVERFRRYRNGMKNEDEITEEHWLQLQHTVEQICPNFRSALNMNQHLSETEYKICLLIKIGFTPSDIDVILKKEYTFGSKARTRIAQKLFKTGGKGAQLDDFIQSLW